MAGLQDLTSAVATQTAEGLADVILQRLDPATDLPSGKLFVFQYFPETIEDSKEVNIPTKDIPGGSLPLYQWISSGARLINFTATFSCDIDLLVRGSTKADEIWAALDGYRRRNVDIRVVMAYLRHLQMPQYLIEGASLTLPAPKLFLTIPNSGIGLIGGVGGSLSLIPDSIVCLLLTSNFTIMSYFPSGLPRVMEAALSFAQIAQLGGTVQFPQSSAADGGDILGGGALQDGRKLFAYDVTPRNRG